MFWTAEDVLDATADTSDWNDILSEEDRRFISTMLTWLTYSQRGIGTASADLIARFCAEVQIPEARCFYGFQIMACVPYIYVVLEQSLTRS